MAICIYCQKETTDPEITSCYGNRVKFFGDESYQVIPHASEDGSNCPECHVTPGGNHHAGCTMELCPICKKPYNQDLEKFCICTDARFLSM